MMEPLQSNVATADLRGPVGFGAWAWSSLTVSPWLRLIRSACHLTTGTSTQPSSHLQPSHSVHCHWLRTTRPLPKGWRPEMSWTQQIKRAASLLIQAHHTLGEGQEWWLRQISFLCAFVLLFRKILLIVPLTSRSVMLWLCGSHVW